MKAIIMAAGESTRTAPLTLTRPKALLPVMNRPILAHQLDALAGLAESVVIVVGYREDMIRERFGAEFEGMPLTYVSQRERRGTGHAVLQCADLIDGPFLVMNGDDLYDRRDLARVAAMEQAALALTVQDPRPYGIYEVRGDGRVVRLVEKPKEVFSNLANIGVYRFTPEVFDVLRRTGPSERGEIEITSAVQTLAATGDFRVVRAEGHWLPIVYAWNLLDANAFWLEHFLRPENHGEVSPAAHLSGVVHVGRGTVIRPGAVIDGPVYIGDRCEVGPNCWLRPGATMCNGCKVGQASEIKNSILMDGAKAPHHNYVGDSILGEGANLGCGTVTANLRHDASPQKSLVKDQFVDTGRRKLGAILGDHVHTGINTSVYPGRKLWPHTTTRPGQIVDRDIIA